MHGKVRIEQMTPDELQETIQHRPIMYVPCGLIEWHGKHLPLGLDGLKTHATLMGCVRRTGGAILPINWIGAPGYGAFCGTMCYPIEFVAELLQRTLGQCAKLGARVIALITGHYGAAQKEAIRRAVEAFRATHPEVLVLARPEFEGVRVDGQVPGDHAGKWETSVSLAHFPELVHMDRHAPGEEPIHRYSDAHAEWPEERVPWVWREDLRETSSRELGEVAVAAVQDSIVKAVRELCRQAGVACG